MDRERVVEFYIFQQDTPQETEEMLLRMRMAGVNPQDLANIVAESVEEECVESGKVISREQAQFCAWLRSGGANQYIAGRLGYA